MKKMLRSAAAVALCGCLTVGSVWAAPVVFKDVPSSYWGYSFVTRAAQEGLVSGLGDGTFGTTKPLTNAQFTTMVCNIFYKDEVMTYHNTYKPAEWWRAYMAVAYSNGLLDNTAVGENRKLSNTWSTGAVNAEISRYDMAQIMANLARVQKWTLPSDLDLLAVQRKIADWDKIPEKYQKAVALAYAKNFLAGMDDLGTFKGNDSMQRIHGAVVVCKLLDAKTEEAANIYHNTTKLVNGKDPTQQNVTEALAAQKREFNWQYVWDMKKPYLSKVLGRGYGNDAFLFMLSDRVFGTFQVTTVDASKLKAGDMIYWNATRSHVLVQEVTRDKFYYVSCDSSGRISWDKVASRSDLSKMDTIYSRYEDDTQPYDALANGEEATERNVISAMDTFKRREYGQGSSWDMNYAYVPNTFTSRRTYGAQAFAYYLSDQIFGQLADRTVQRTSEIRAGDVIYRDDEDEYLVVTDVDRTNLYYVTVDRKGWVNWNGVLRLSELDRYDQIYTRYPDNVIGGEGQLANGRPATDRNVSDLLSDVLDSRGYRENDSWDMDKSYSTYLFGRSKGGMAFAGMVSDEVFGDLKETRHTRLENLRVGDVLYLWDDDMYMVVTDVNGSRITYSYVDRRGEISQNNRMNINSLGRNDEIYTRYPQ